MSKTTAPPPTGGDTADEMQRWAETLGVDRAVLREAARRHGVPLAGGHDTPDRLPLSLAGASLGDAGDCGPAEDWDDAAGEG
ncbi:MAG: antitoxin [Actinobacteria bacterium]|nr:antitoxin [Actinomycetota bacterium]